MMAQLRIFGRWQYHCPKPMVVFCMDPEWSFPQLEAPSTAAPSLGTLWDAADEAASTHCSLLAKYRCRHCGPLPSVYGLRRAPDPAAKACQPSLDTAGEAMEQSAC